MAGGAGLYGYWAYAPETTYGTYVAPTRSIPFTPGESLSYDRIIKSGDGIRAGAILRSQNYRKIVGVGGMGDVPFYVPTKGIGSLLTAAFGTVVTAQVGSTTAYTHTFTLGDLTSRSITMQKGVPQLGGTVVPISFLGSKVNALKLSMAETDLLAASVTFDCQDVSLSQSAITPSYPTASNVLSYTGGTITVNGSSYNYARAFDLTIANNLNTTLRYIGGSGKKNSPTRNDYGAVTGTLQVDFADNTFLTNYMADSSIALTLTFQGPLITGSSYYGLSITMPSVKLDGEIPKIASAGSVSQSCGFTVLDPDDGSTQPITAVYTTTDTTP